MITMATSSVVEYLKSRFPELDTLLKNGHIDKQSQKSVGVFLGSHTRSGGNLAIGGIDNTVVRMLPVNINIHWSQNQKEHDDFAIKIYNKMLLEESNFELSDVKIACIQMLDACPQPIGRDSKNVCESVIRANFFYYV